MDCPKCSTALDFDEDELDEGDEFTCEDCGANIRVAGVDPVELESPEDAAADDDDDFDEDEDEDEDEEDDDEDEDDAAEEDWR